jgi:hypothetical protein
MKQKLIMNIPKYNGPFILRQKLSLLISNNGFKKQQTNMKLKKKKQHPKSSNQLINRHMKIMPNSQLRPLFSYKL